MKKILLAVLPFLLIVQQLNAQCIEEDQHKVLLVGDSWAFFMGVDQTFDDVFDHWGHSNATFYTNATLAVNGARTDDFLEEFRLTEIENKLNQFPSISAVHISLGGNDFLGDWNVDFTAEETEALSDEVFENIITITNFIKDVRPDIQLVYSGYMYANFEEVIYDIAPFEMGHPFYTNWEEMGFPSFLELNTLLNDFSTRVYEWTLDDPQIEFINAPALMQRLYGQETELGVDPGGTYPPFFQPLPFGDPVYPSPKESMRDYGITRDCFHLSADGFFKMIDYQTQKFYHKFLMENIHFFAEPESTGTINAESETVETTLAIGSDEGESYAIHLSFNTAGLADTLITGASIFLRRDSLVGDNPLGEWVYLRMINGFFGDSELVEGTDLTTETDIEESVCVFGMNSANDQWIRIDLPESFLPFITAESELQFTIQTEEETPGRLFYAGTDNDEFAPVLSVKYKEEVAGIQTNMVEKPQLVLYPNPVTNYLTITSLGAEIQELEIVNANGQRFFTRSVMNSDVSVNTINWPNGIYWARLTTSKGVNVKTFIVNH